MYVPAIMGTIIIVRNSSITLFHCLTSPFQVWASIFVAPQRSSITLLTPRSIPFVIVLIVSLVSAPRDANCHIFYTHLDNLHLRISILFVVGVPLGMFGVPYWNNIGNKHHIHCNIPICFFSFPNMCAANASTSLSDTLEYVAFPVNTLNDESLCTLVVGCAV